MPNPTKVPNVIDDGGVSGNWNVLDSYDYAPSFPFSDKGDNQSFTIAQRYKIDKNAYRPRATMSATQFPQGLAYLTKLGTPRDTGCGIYDVEDIFSSVPVTRTEYGSYCYQQQWYDTVANTDVDPSKYFYNVTYDIAEQSFTVSGEYLYEYFINTAPVTLRKPRVYFIFGRLYYDAAGGKPYTGTKIIADDSAVTIYAGRIFERKTPYVLINTGTAVSS